MERRRFVTGCAAVATVAGLSASARAWAVATPHFYSRARLVDVHGDPLKARQLVSSLLRADGATYAWSGGVGARHSVVAFSAICAHKLAYPTREVSFIRFQPSRSPTSDGNVIHCCADHSVYDPAAGARVVSGPAPQPLAAILLDYDPERDELSALGTVGAEQFDAFFRKYNFKLALDYGAGKARLPVGATTVVRELTEYCRQTIQC
ncbi:MAG: Rieske 2Fe-2S domain-containing protein [Betaproteobacteria bacterium]|nr:MAG: Rieske 2Fe-2S domain-containing protein [Betaproteobacteria bacterium]